MIAIERNLFVDTEIWNNLMTWNHDLIAWPWLRIFYSPPSVSTRENGGMGYGLSPKCFPQKTGGGCPPLPSRQCATLPCWDSTFDVWRLITPPSQVRIDIDTTRAVNATSHSRWPCFSSGRCTGLECIAFVGHNIVDVLGVSSPAENTAIQGILWRPDMIALYICCTALTANFDNVLYSALQHFLR